MNTTSFANLRQTSIALAVAAVLCGNSAMASASAASTPITVARTTTLERGDAVIGTLPMTQPISIAVALKMRDRAGLDALIANNQAHSVAPKLMTPAQFMVDHAPTQAQAQTVVDYLTRMGYTNVVVAPNRLLVTADGTAATARNAFTTTFEQVRTHDGRVAFANTEDVRIPASLQDSVLAVLGLQTVHEPHTFSQVVTHGGPGYNPVSFSSIYGGAGLPTAAGVTVGIVTAGRLAQVYADLDTFTTKYHLPKVTTETVNTAGPVIGPVSDFTSEWDIDSQDVLGMGGGKIGKIIFYNEPELTDKGDLANYNTIVTEDQAKIITESSGLCETLAQSQGDVAADDQTLSVGVAQGQTFSFSAGDNGSDECGNSTPILGDMYPASSPYAIGAGGTTLTASATTWSDETVWVWTGGSPSLIEPKPSWQDTLVPGTTRGVSDIAFDGDPNSGTIIIVDGKLAQYGGTSLSSPLFAGLWARVIAMRGTNVGFAAPLIYALPATDFHDITVGNNGSETAKVGYDYPTGRGSIILSSAIKHIPGGDPPTANFDVLTGGLSAFFTDSSTDSEGIIASHTWHFGDGTTSTGLNPGHTYAKTGIYSVSETIANEAGQSSTKTESVAAGGTDLLQNTGFETGVATPWTITPATALTSDASLAHSGNWFAKIGGTAASTDHVSQIVTIPSGKTSANLTFYLHTTTTETSKTVKSDVLYVQIHSPTGALLAQIGSCTNLDASSGYVLHNLDLSKYIGQQVEIMFVGINNATLPTTWDLDDVKLWVQ